MVRCARVEGARNPSDRIMKVVSVNRSQEHSFSKTQVPEIYLLEGIGVESDAHSGRTVQHRSRIAANPNAPNLRQVHLVQEELFSELMKAGFDIKPGDIGENITTRGIDLLSLPKGAILMLGESARVEITGLRNPCSQLDRFENGLMAAVLEKDPEGNLKRKAGIMGIVIKGGRVRPGDQITISLPAGPHEELGVV